MIAERLDAHAHSPTSTGRPAADEDVLGVGLVANAAPDMPTKPAIVTYAFENLEIAAYHVRRGLATRATVAFIDQILEQEGAEAEHLASTFDRAPDLALAQSVPERPL